MRRKMIRNKSDMEDRGIEIDLTGPDGNAFALMGIAKKLSKKLGKDWVKIQKKMMKGDYTNLVNTFEEEFGSAVTIYK